MSKRGISQIKGPTEVRLGEKVFYEVSRIYDLADKSKVETTRWKLYVLDEHTTSWRELKPKYNDSAKVGYRVPLQITNQMLVGKILMMEAYIYEPERRSPPGVMIKLLPGTDKKITRVDLFKIDDTPIKEDTILKYNQSIKVKVYTQNMPGEKMRLSLYEDDVNGGGHNKRNEQNKVAEITKKLNEKGFLWQEFKLNPNFAKIANAMMDGSQDKLHEYYVVVETAEHKSVSKNVEVENPDYIKIQTVSSSGVDTNKTYGETLIEEVVIIGKMKKQIGTNPPVDLGNKVVTVFEPDKKKKEESKVCEYEARVRAFMRMLRFKEGTEDESGYTKLFGHSNFTKPPYNKSMSTHPNISIPFGKTSSNAAGAYQIMGDTYKNLTGNFENENKKWIYSEKLDKAKTYKITSFDQESQDKLCLIIMKYNYLKDRASSFYNPTFWKDKDKKIHDTEKEAKAKEWRKRFKGQQGDIIQMIIDNDIKRAALISSLCWSSLPDAPYGQQSPTYTFAIVKAIYENYLREELTETQSWNVHLKKGFLKEFGYECCGGKMKIDDFVKQNNKCPEDCSQCFEYADIWENPEISSDNHGKNNNRFGYNSARGHKGIDIVSGPVYKDVHSLMCGEVTSVVNTFKTNEYKFQSLGNTLMIKSKDKEGKTVFILYCHLNKIFVKKGDKIKHGQKVAQSGSTGNASSSEFPNGAIGHGINKKYWHCHIEAATKGEGYNNFLKLGSYRIKAEDYMKTKFDKNGNAIK